MRLFREYQPGVSMIYNNQKAWKIKALILNKTSCFLKCKMCFSQPSRTFHRIVCLACDCRIFTLFTLHCCRIPIGLTRERPIGLCLPSWTHLRIRCCGEFLYCQELEGSLPALGRWHCESYEIAENEKVKADSTIETCFS